MRKEGRRRYRIRVKSPSRRQADHSRGKGGSSQAHPEPEAVLRLGVNRVRGILLSGPPGCGKTLLARELAALLGAREPQIVNGPEILDKFIGEAEKRVQRSRNTSRSQMPQRCTSSFLMKWMPLQENVVQDNY